MSTVTVGSRVPRDRTIFIAPECNVCRRIAPKCTARRRILVAGMGTSPAVLTETVWALSHQEQPVVPDEIVVITTKSGKEAFRSGFHHCEIEIHVYIVILGYKCYNAYHSP